jgi:hypothetical protein
VQRATLAAGQYGAAGFEQPWFPNSRFHRYAVAHV